MPFLCCIGVIWCVSQVVVAVRSWDEAKNVFLGHCNDPAVPFEARLIPGGRDSSVIVSSYDLVLTVGNTTRCALVNQSCGEW